jgi:hypothetical protein
MNWGSDRIEVNLKGCGGESHSRQTSQHSRKLEFAWDPLQDLHMGHSDFLKRHKQGTTSEGKTLINSS